MIAQEIAKPLRNVNALDYLPSQYINDFIRSKSHKFNAPGLPQW